MTLAYKDKSEAIKTDILETNGMRNALHLI